jgi:hypothetical protein
VVDIKRIPRFYAGVICRILSLDPQRTLVLDFNYIGMLLSSQYFVVFSQTYQPEGSKQRVTNRVAVPALCLN